MCCDSFCLLFRKCSLEHRDDAMQPTFPTPKKTKTNILFRKLGNLSTLIADKRYQRAGTYLSLRENSKPNKPIAQGILPNTVCIYTLGFFVRFCSAEFVANVDSDNCMLVRYKTKAR